MGLTSSQLPMLLGILPAFISSDTLKCQTLLMVVKWAPGCWRHLPSVTWHFYFCSDHKNGHYIIPQMADR